MVNFNRIALAFIAALAFISPVSATQEQLTLEGCVISSVADIENAIRAQVDNHIVINLNQTNIDLGVLEDGEQFTLLWNWTDSGIDAFNDCPALSEATVRIRTTRVLSDGPLEFVSGNTQNTLTQSWSLTNWANSFVGQPISDSIVATTVGPDGLNNTVLQFNQTYTVTTEVLEVILPEIFTGGTTYDLR